jgi:hypothetical protein
MTSIGQGIGVIEGNDKVMVSGSKKDSKIQDSIHI